jgi:hypothetical protein
MVASAAPGKVIPSGAPLTVKHAPVPLDRTTFSRKTTMPSGARGGLPV